MFTRNALIHTRWRCGAAIAVFLALQVVSLIRVGAVVTAPLSFLVTALIAWDFGLAASLAWLVAARGLTPLVLYLWGTGPFYLLPANRGLILTLLITSLVVEAALAWLTARLRTTTDALRDSKHSLEVANRELQSALDEVKELRGFLPICAWCKDVRDVSGNWEQIESYVSRHSRAVFTHGVCPKCLAEQMQNIDSTA